MRAKRLYVIAMAIGLAGAIAAAGWAVGTLFGKAQARQTSLANEGARADGVLARSTGIRVGAGFPNLQLWDTVGNPCGSLSELLPDGGGVLYVTPDCGSCFQASMAFDSWLKGQDDCPHVAIIVTDNLETTPKLVRLLRDSLVSLPIHCDVTRTLRLEHKMLEGPAFFVVQGAELKLERAGVWAQSVGFVDSHAP